MHERTYEITGSDLAVLVMNGVRLMLDKLMNDGLITESVRLRYCLDNEFEAEEPSPKFEAMRKQHDLSVVPRLRLGPRKPGIGDCSCNGGI